MLRGTLALRHEVALARLPIVGVTRLLLAIAEASEWPLAALQILLLLSGCAIILLMIYAAIATSLHAAAIRAA